MTRNRLLVSFMLGMLTTFANGMAGRGDVVTQVTGWAVHNGSSTVTNGSTNSPTFTAADNITVMGTFAGVNLANDGDFVKLTTTLTVATRSTNTGVNSLNTQLRIGLFDGPAGAVVASDFPNTGFIIEYSNAVAGGLIREQTSGTQPAPFVSPTDIGNGTQDIGADSIRGADVGPVAFELTLTRNAGKIDLTGQISGTDSSNGNAYLATYSKLAYTPAGFVYDRVGFFFGGNVDGPNGTLSNVEVTSGNILSVPESRFVMLAATVAAGCVTTGRRLCRRSRSLG